MTNLNINLSELGVIYVALLHRIQHLEEVIVPKLMDSDLKEIYIREIDQLKYLSEKIWK